jgi:hypothetical protein
VKTSRAPTDAREPDLDQVPGGNRNELDGRARYHQIASTDSQSSSSHMQDQPAQGTERSEELWTRQEGSGRPAHENWRAI